MTIKRSRSESFVGDYLKEKDNDNNTWDNRNVDLGDEDGFVSLNLFLKTLSDIGFSEDDIKKVQNTFEMNEEQQAQVLQEVGLTNEGFAAIWDKSKLTPVEEADLRFHQAKRNFARTA